jgi:hypothetical protein
LAEVTQDGGDGAVEVGVALEFGGDEEGVAGITDGVGVISGGIMELDGADDAGALVS